METDLRVGQGWDLHRLVEGRPLVLGGVAIPYDRGLAGHSDADVLTHALIDAILGALGAGDIGTLYPDTDPTYKGASSLAFLREVVGRAARSGRTVVNADLTVVAEAPKIGPHRDAIRASLARALGVEAARVSVKAKTAEGCGSEGRGEAISASAVVLLAPAGRRGGDHQ